MARIAPLTLDELPQDTRRALVFAQETMGFTANDVLTMARWPQLLSALEQLVGTIYESTEIDPLLKRLIALVASSASGCRYCQAHTAHGAVKQAGGDEAKVAAVWEYATSPLFTKAERAALDLALAAAQQPNASNDEHFEALRAHYSERQILEIVAMISLFGLLNRWNSTLATELETAPLDVASKTIPDFR
ncbi:carboxymuconolactone decarboxylase family protein [Aurantiacibacter aquimixticola]|uniref:Carboxymuconolactone decarboxylase n=1 Tax=Aurantiacibacter aquimixticola TaxID=1958945 RepID=A0A419RW93_9SPHN|nr:carboxymuconolactone decarboxylase family protein [Aurantiacibacter aquimixticola]RJY10062.1 carboxymuconolactone decarboxylase [Aurantiacibacter aquimixticola]